jgi:hypothetical protein
MVLKMKSQHFLLIMYRLCHLVKLYNYCYPSRLNPSTYYMRPRHLSISRIFQHFFLLLCITVRKFSDLDINKYMVMSINLKNFILFFDRMCGYYRSVFLHLCTCHDEDQVKKTFSHLYIESLEVRLKTLSTRFENDEIDRKQYLERLTFFVANQK